MLRFDASRAGVSLSAREHEIVLLVMQSYKNREIAAKLFVCERTVKNHLYSVFKRIGVSDRRELVRHCLEGGLHPRQSAKPQNEKTVVNSVSTGIETNF